MVSIPTFKLDGNSFCHWKESVTSELSLAVKQTMVESVSSIERRSFCQRRRQLDNVRRSLTFEARHTLVNRMDHYNTVLHAVPVCTIHRLQMVMTAAARLIVSAGRNEHITLVLRDVLHWLRNPVQGGHPRLQLSPWHQSVIYIHNSFTAVPNIPGHRAKTSTFGRRSFTSAGPFV